MRNGLIPTVGADMEPQHHVGLLGGCPERIPGFVVVGSRSRRIPGRKTHDVQADGRSVLQFCYRVFDLQHWHESGKNQPLWRNALSARVCLDDGPE